jgi:hypothetical protein
VSPERWEFPALKPQHLLDARLFADRENMLAHLELVHFTISNPVGYS